MFKIFRASKLEQRLEELEGQLREKEEQGGRDFLEVIEALDEQFSSSNPSGIHVTTARAIQQPTVWACARIISEIMASLPILVQTRQGGSWKTAEQHDAQELLYEPNEWMTKHELISFLVVWSELRGNSFLFKNTVASGKVKRLLPLEGNSVTVDMSSDWKLRYQVGSLQQSGIYDGRKIFHHRNFGVESHVGLSTIGNHRMGISVALQLQEHAASAYKNGLQTSKWVSGNKPAGKDRVEDLKKQLAKFQGATNAGKIPFIPHDFTLNEAKGISEVDAQYIESRKMQKQEIASIFGVPLFLLNDTEKSTTWGSGLEELSRSFVRYSLGPRFNRLSETLVKQLISAREKRTTRFKFDTTEFTLGEFKERMEGYKSSIESGVFNPNEARQIEGYNPREGGDEYRKPLNIGMDGEDPDDEPEPEPVPVPDDDEDED